MVTGVTRSFSGRLEDVRALHRPQAGPPRMGVSLVLRAGRTVLVADTAVHRDAGAEELAEIAIEAAGVRASSATSRGVALLAFATFGHPPGDRSARVQEAVRILDQRRVDFEYDGEMAADVALNPDLWPPFRSAG